MSDAQQDGSPDAPIMLIGESPSWEDIAAAAPMSDGYGAMFWAVAKAHGLTRKHFYIVNVIGEFPALRRGKPSQEQVNRFHSRFNELTSVFTGHFVVPCGGLALTAVGLTEGIDSWRGYLVPPGERAALFITRLIDGVYKSSGKGHKKGDPRLIKERVKALVDLGPNVTMLLPMLSPAGVMRSGRKTMPAFNADMARLGRALRRELDKSLEWISYGNCVPETDSAAFVVDLETAPYMRIGLAGRLRGNLISGTALWSMASDTALRSNMSAGRTFVAHNIQFDLGELAKHDIHWDGQIFDTMFAAYILQPDLYKGLNEVASLYLDRPRWKHKAEEDDAIYNVTDAEVEYELFEILQAALKEEGMLDRFNNVFMPALRELILMTDHGLRVNGPRRQAWLNDLTIENLELTEKWSELVGSVNPKSPQQLVALLYDKLKLPVQFGKEGRPTAERAALWELLADLAESDPRRPIIEVLKAYRINDKLLGTYAKRAIEDDGCFHPYYLPVTKDSDNQDTGKGAAGTGRIQPRGPNVNQLPPSARNMIIPHSADDVIVSIDRKQLELRIAAALSKDTALQDMLATEDPFETIKTRLGCDRTLGKVSYYATIYGGGPKSICRALRGRGIFITLAQAKAIQDSIAKSSPKLWAWRNHVMNVVGSTHSLRTPFGRVRYFYQGRGDGPAAVDFLCQGTAADIQWEDLMLAGPLVRELGGHLLVPVYDELVMELPKAGLSDSIPKIVQLLERPFDQISPGFIAPVGVKIGPSWGEVEKWS